MINDLVKIIPPPNNPKAAGSLTEFDSFEKIHNLKFPQDYKDLIRTYGSGTLGDMIQILSPFRLVDGISEYASVEQRTRHTYQELKAEFPYYHPFDYYPSMYGILLWGTTINGDELFWYKVQEDPNEWQIIVWQSRSVNYWLYPSDVTTFLTRIFSKQYECPAFGRIANKRIFVESK